MYQNKILIESNKIPEALTNLVESKEDIVDDVTRLESLVEVITTNIIKDYLFIFQRYIITPTHSECAQAIESIGT